MEIGGIKINLPKIGGNKAPKTEKYADLNGHAQDVYQKHSAEEVQQAMSEFSSLNTGEGRKFDFVDSCTFRYLYKQNLIDIDRIKGGYGSLAKVRKQELLCAYNRYRKIKIK